ncbi:MAG TPA: histidinol-phosphate transaminase [Burkholderiaceae bacterium]|nr:histidinol-phosphate transaminase [Burkholderiaceae bacterium]
MARVVRADIAAMTAYAVPSAAGLIKLDAMENPYELPEPLRAELAARLAAVALNRYPAPSCQPLKAGLARAFEVPPGAALVLGNGSDELITLMSVLTARPGACVLSPWPSFVMYEVSARLAGSRFVGVALNDDFTLDTPAMLAAIEREQPALIWIAYPNNPTGNCFDDAGIEAIVRAAPGLVVIDEAYRPFAEASWMPRLADHPNLLVLRTVSKLGLAGLRLGYLAGSPAWIEQIDKVRPPYNINVLTEAAALFALDHLPVLLGQAAQIRADRSLLQAQLAALAGVQTFPSRANFVLARLPDGASAARGLLERGVLVKDMGKMHPSLNNCLRFTVGTPEENSALMAALAIVLHNPS